MIGFARTLADEVTETMTESLKQHYAGAAGDPLLSDHADDRPVLTEAGVTESLGRDRSFQAMVPVLLAGVIALVMVMIVVNATFS